MLSEVMACAHVEYCVHICSPTQVRTGLGRGTQRGSRSAGDNVVLVSGSKWTALQSEVLCCLREQSQHKLQLCMCPVHCTSVLIWRDHCDEMHSCTQRRLRCTTSACVPLAQDPEGARRGGIPEALSRSTEGSDFYKHEDRLCKKCAAGFHLVDHCSTPNTSGSCAPCKEGLEFTEYPNALPKCLSCRVCRKDEVQLSPCNSSKNTQCACKNGTFCSPDHPCEICHRCRTSCPIGEVQVSSCTRQSDIQCAHPTGPPPAAGSITARIAVGILVPLLLLVLLSVYVWHKCSHSYSSGGNHTKKSASLKVLPGNQVSEMTSRRRKLVPMNGKDPIETLRRSFDTFVQEVPFKDWRRYVRALLLTENEIEMAERSDKYSQEPHYQMLCTWQNKTGAGASVNQLLETLDKMDLRGVADLIHAKLIGLYEEEELN
ncbi:tumor necrosis factor receptor superfamily member 10B-like isoform X2 [Carettochelys insculpta]|uniref:tumor necrosis factor receptor superfamily member 10B-like isoform X2 n=1 Tax=Carettochelys insculpta TaxID=44489 RepID=UPI003EBF51C4